MNSRQQYRYPINDAALFKKQVVSFYERQAFFVFLESNLGHEKYDTYSSLIAVGAIDSLIAEAGNAFHEFHEFRRKNQDWAFGFFGYDLKNELEELHSDHKDSVGFPDLCFFVPELVLEIGKEHVIIHSFIKDHTTVEQLVQQIQNAQIKNKPSVHAGGMINARDSKQEYLTKAQKFLDHIHLGDIYEANFCTEFYGSNILLDSSKAFYDLNEISEPPFAVLARFKDYHVVSASPERYLKKKGSQLISQPIKGTAKRSFSVMEDESLKEQLFNDPKERSENVMIVDLVRNDMSRVAVKGSVAVEELFGIYTFKQVHQMISTVTAKLNEEFSALDAIKHTFPMGSMTGAPKISAMKIIEENESFKRGLYSGALGYMTPQDDFDFNVVIRTILYNANTQKLSFAVGSALTAAAIPHKEYEECFLKARALIETLRQQGISFA